MMIRNYAKQSCGLFTGMAGKIAAMTFMQYVNFVNHRPIGQIKYAHIQIHFRNDRGDSHLMQQYSTSSSKNNNNMKSVIVYFTHSGNTELAAKQLAEITRAKMIRILPEQPYSSEDVNWVNKQSRCTQEHLNQSLSPAIKPIDIDFATGQPYQNLGG